VPAQPTIRADQRPALARQQGVPWWGAVLIAVTMTLAGMGIEAGLGHQELGSPFAIGYSLGCVLAVLAVRQSGIFTAVIQPPLLLFVAVPLAYYLFHNSAFSGLKEIAITCGYPLIERFPLMLFTSSAVLLIGLVRWYLALSRPGGRAEAADRAPQQGLFAGLSTKLSSAFAGTGSVDERPGQRAARPRHGADRPTGGKRRPAKPNERTSERPRRARPAGESAQRQGRGPSRSREAERGAEPRRRSGEQRDPRRGSPPPRREGRDRRDHREPYPPSTRGSRYEPHEPSRGYQSHPAYPGYPQDPRQTPRRRPAPNGASESHHPVSRVRYRDSGPSDADYRSR
jgi:hypothetical protein